MLWGITVTWILSTVLSDSRHLVDLFLPVLMKIIRTDHVPIALKTSALSLIGDCAKTSAAALSQYLADLTQSMVDLLQVEASQKREEEDHGTLDSNPTSTHSKHPPIRRAALHLLTTIFRECTQHAHGARPLGDIDSSVVHRARNILSYTAATDADNVARVMAREALESLQSLEKALVGL